MMADQSPRNTRNGAPEKSLKGEHEHQPIGQRMPESRNGYVDRQQGQQESYSQQQARLDAEAVDRWAEIVADWPPLPQEQIQALAVILNRIDARCDDSLPPC